MFVISQIYEEETAGHKPQSAQTIHDDIKTCERFHFERGIYRWILSLRPSNVVLGDFFKLQTVWGAAKLVWYIFNELFIIHHGKLSQAFIYT